MILDADKSKLIDMRDCQSSVFREINDEMREIFREMQPLWLRILLRWEKLSRRLEILTSRTRKWEYPWAVLSAELKPGMRVLDAGCGGSPFLLYLYKRGLHCYGVDRVRSDNIDELGIYRYARRRLKDMTGIIFWGGHNPAQAKYPPSIIYMDEPIQKLSFDTGYFDRVFCLSIIEHIPREEWKICMRELVRVLKPYGKLIITMDMSSRNVFEYKDVFQYCGVQSLHSIDHSTPWKIRHPDHTYETVGLVLAKQEGINTT